MVLFPILILLAAAVCGPISTSARSFDIDYSSDTFRLDGKAFRYVSGSLHYFRVPRELWQDRMRKIRAGGYNAIQFVIPWNLHEPAPGKYNFEEMYDISAFMKMAQDESLYILLRPGPYICAEHNGGGLPFWLYQMYPNITLRSSDPQYLTQVDKWWKVLLPRIAPHLYINGGNVLMVQLENEYGSYGLQTGHCDVKYMAHLRDLAKSILGPNILLYTTDGDGDGYVRCGSVQGAYATVDFGPGANVTAAFQTQRHFEPHGPLVNSEFYPGWLDYWGQPHNTVDGNWSAQSLDAILAAGANVNIYMAHGGTSFGFDNGANTPPFQVEPTSYDYDAPISEAGDLTDKYFAFKEVISKYSIQYIENGIPMDSWIKNDNKGNYGKVPLKFVSSFFMANGTILQRLGVNDKPLTFEQVGQENGFMLYETTIDKLYSDPVKLQIKEIHDRAYIYVNRQPRGILSRTENVISMPLSLEIGDVLQILVENQGRVGYGAFAKDFKGIVSNVTLGDESSGKAVALNGWTMYSMALNDTKALLKYATTLMDLQKTNMELHQILGDDLQETRGKGSFWYGEFTLPCIQDAEALDTFLQLPNGWRKGIAFVNTKNIGKYWPRNGPQETLYVPGVWLNKPCVKNTLILFEQENPGCMKNECYVQLVDKHVINGTTPYVPHNHHFNLFDREN